MKRLRYLTYSVLIAVVFGTNACGSDSAEGSDGSGRRYDVATLNSGNYPTAPVDVTNTRNTKEGAEEAGRIREAVRIGNSTALAMDIDSRLVFDPHGYIKVTRITIPRVPPVFADVGIGEKEFDSLAPGFVAGWHTKGQRRKEVDYGRSLVMHVMRFAGPEEARSAVRNLADRAMGEPTRITGYSEARAAVLRERFHNRPFLSTWHAHGDMVLYVRINDPISIPFDPAPLVEITKNALDKQVEMLKNYTPIAVDKIASLPPDVDGMLSRTLPLGEESSHRVFDPSGVYPRQAVLHTENFPNLAQAAYDDAGVDVVSVAMSTVYRTRDPASTTRLIAALEAQHDPDKYDKLNSPPDMPGTDCFTYKPGGSILTFAPVCYVAFDRYVAEVGSHNLQELYQRTAAQYKLLADGR